MKPPWSAGKNSKPNEYSRTIFPARYFSFLAAFCDKSIISWIFSEEESFLKIRAKRFFDLGANDGRYTRPALKHGAELAAAADSDSAAVEFNYQSGKKNGENILPLISISP